MTCPCYPTTGLSGGLPPLEIGLAAHPGILAAAWLMVRSDAVVIGSALREARAAGVGFLAAVGKRLRALGRFVFWFL